MPRVARPSDFLARDDWKKRIRKSHQTGLGIAQAHSARSLCNSTRLAQTTRGGRNRSQSAHNRAPAGKPGGRVRHRARRSQQALWLPLEKSCAWFGVAHAERAGVAAAGLVATVFAELVTGFRFTVDARFFLPGAQQPAWRNREAGKSVVEQGKGGGCHPALVAPGGEKKRL